ncbi:MAG: hypothetical protein UX43_C0004G0040 [Candidatus Giovannonibacteria bacterium GW2011_GWB1_46_20]|uniref:Uncharacterized protein n=1 Tax=Candidatus Giovannonibacteria bacterium GW2011_GWA1_44_25 TaxID=1618645 RepID=A0A0G1ILU9_9BACT|nr:MAG: hypothetical protein UW15_C0006G0004 [Parcubacteria group bacterium GW2011_GWC1_44_10]KKT59893.1 MAG: hypothetical protein UW53_C0006G0040 [Candidatus Giovannonibacteria bacterium GW2011_GWA1_44_25]KKU29879.1 MAG: hypothetical protein UX43_C0004G0040 [Candidatus Giovannonibacteria bacterium GW2011_GWB1_46_20]
MKEFLQSAEQKIEKNDEVILRGVDFEKGEPEKIQDLFNQKVAEHSAELAK